MPVHEQFDVLRREIESDLQTVQSLMAQLAAARKDLSGQPGQKELAYVGYLLHGIYTGWEGAFRRIATLFENRLDPANWHVQLLNRMSLDLPGIRPAVIDEDTRQPLHKLRSFRHFFRHNYAAELRYDEMQLVLKAYDAAAPKMGKCFVEFLAKVEQIAKQAEEDEP